MTTRIKGLFLGKNCLKMSQRENALALMKLWFNVYFHQTPFSSEFTTDFLSKNFFVPECEITKIVYKGNQFNVNA